jgi:hypothetical protein
MKACLLIFAVPQPFWAFRGVTREITEAKRGLNVVACETFLFSVGFTAVPMRYSNLISISR